MKLLTYMESPMNATGFGHVNRHLLAALSKEADVTCVASSHAAQDYDRAAFPYEIIPCDSLVDLAAMRNLDNVKRYIEETAWDIFFYQGDFGANNEVLIWVHQQLLAHPERELIFYLPLDCDVVLPVAFDILKLATVPVVYTQHARRVIQKYDFDLAAKTSVIWLGCDTQDFYPLSPDEKVAARVEIFGEAMLGRFLALCVNRNQQRKDLARCMGAFHLFHEQHPDSTLYMHSVMQDAGGLLPVQAQLIGCDVAKKPPEVAFSTLDLAHAWSRETLNKLYNAVDVLVSTSFGEGWGLTTTEAMCAGTPVLVPQNTANLDIIGDGLSVLGDHGERGWFIKTGGDLDHTIFIYGTEHNGSPHDIIHADSFVHQLEYIYRSPMQTRVKAEAARAWCLENGWDRREREWQQLLQTIKASRLTTA